MSDCTFHHLLSPHVYAYGGRVLKALFSPMMFSDCLCTNSRWFNATLNWYFYKKNTFMVTDVGTAQIGVIYHHHRSHLPERKVWVRDCGRLRDESPGLGKGRPHFKGSHARLRLAAGIQSSGQPGGPHSFTGSDLWLILLYRWQTCAEWLVVLFKVVQPVGRWNSSGQRRIAGHGLSFAWNSFPPTSHVLCVADPRAV